MTGTLPTSLIGLWQSLEWLVEHISLDARRVIRRRWWASLKFSRKWQIQKFWRQNEECEKFNHNISISLSFPPVRDIKVSSCPGLVSRFGFFDNLFRVPGSAHEHYMRNIFDSLFLMLLKVASLWSLYWNNLKIFAHAKRELQPAHKQRNYGNSRLTLQNI